MKLQKRVDSIVKNLSTRGIIPLKVDPRTEITDPAIWITESIYIQVGIDYVVVFRSRPNSLATYNCTMRIDDIIGKLRQAIDEGK